MRIKTVKEEAIESLKTAKWTHDMYLTERDRTYVEAQGQPQTTALMERGIPAVITNSKHITRETCMQAGLCCVSSDTAREGVVSNAEGELIIFGDFNLAYLANKDVPIPNAERHVKNSVMLRN